MDHPIACPNCKIPTKHYQSQSHYGTPIILDQCQSCGGLWFDGMELLQVKIGEADNITFNRDALTRYKTILSNPLYCPRNGTQLTEFEDPNFPTDLIIDYCVACGGF